MFFVFFVFFVFLFFFVFWFFSFKASLIVFSFLSLSVLPVSVFLSFVLVFFSDQT